MSNNVNTMAALIATLLIMNTPLSLGTQSAHAPITILAEVSLGELIDKITILQIKNERIKNPEKLHNIRTELELLQVTLHQSLPISNELQELFNQLKRVNEALWIIEDDIREKERTHKYDTEFIQLARSVYITNDHRGLLKRKINELFDSHLIEEKEYTTYTMP